MRGYERERGGIREREGGEEIGERGEREQKERERGGGREGEGYIYLSNTYNPFSFFLSIIILSLFEKKVNSFLYLLYPPLSLSISLYYPSLAITVIPPSSLFLFLSILSTPLQ